MSQQQNASAQSTTSQNANEEFSQTLNSAQSSTYNRDYFIGTMIVINHRITGDKHEWFASLGNKRLTEFHDSEESLHNALHSLPFYFTLCSAIAEDVFDFKLKKELQEFRQYATDNINQLSEHKIYHEKLSTLDNNINE